MRSQSTNSFLLHNFILAHHGNPERFSPESDHVWAVSLANGGPSAFTCQTTYGLRAKSMRVFPGFISGGNRITDSGQYFRGPSVSQYCPNFLQITCEPAPGATYQFDLYLIEPDVLAGRVKVTNTGSHPLSMGLELCTVLIPMGKGTPTMPDHKGRNHIIVGQTEDIAPVLFMTGGPHAINSPYPALAIPIELQPGEERILSWALAAKSSQSESLETARKATARSFVKFITPRLMAHHEQILRINTGNAEWDSAFELAQTCAHNHLITRDAESGAFTIKRTRLPDDSHHRGGHNQYRHDLTALEAWHLGEIFLPGSVDAMVKIVENFLDSLEADGRLPSRLSPPGLGVAFQELPLLGQICLEIDNIRGDPTFLAKVFPILSRILESWFTPERDPDSDGFPTLENTAQLQMESGLFNFDIWENTGRGFNIRLVETPGLASFLHRETTALAEIARRIHQDAAHQNLLQKAEDIKGLIQETWNPYRKRFDHRDVQSHQTTKPNLIYQGPHQDILLLNHDFNNPQRLHIELQTDDEHTRVCSVNLSGLDTQGKPIEENIRSRKIHWVLGRAYLTTQSLFKNIQSIIITGLNSNDRIRVQTPDLTIGDLSCLLPAWSLAATRQQIESILKKHLDPNREELVWGIPETLKPASKHPAEYPIRVNLLWNTLIISGLERLGFKTEAADLFTKLMTTIIEGLRQFEGFYPTYDALTGQPIGKRNLIAGLPPLRLFLQIAGIRIFSPHRVAIWGNNPFPWPVRIEWRGLMVKREGNQTKLTFPDGQIFTTDSTDPAIIQQ